MEIKEFKEKIEDIKKFVLESLEKDNEKGYFTFQEHDSECDFMICYAIMYQDICVGAVSYLNDDFKIDDNNNIRFKHLDFTVSKLETAIHNLKIYGKLKDENV